MAVVGGAKFFLAFGASSRCILRPCVVNQLVTWLSMDVAFGVSVVLATFLDHAVVEGAFSAANAASC